MNIRLEERVDERRDSGSLRQNQERAKNHEHNYDRYEPEFSPRSKKSPKFREDRQGEPFAKTGCASFPAPAREEFG